MADTEDYSEEATPTAHHESHEKDGDDETSVAGLSGVTAALAVHALIPTAHQDAPALISTHKGDASAHHAKYTDVNARAAINNIFGADGKADADIDLDGHDLINGTVDGVEVGDIGNELILEVLDDCGDTSTIIDWVEGADGLNPADNQVYVEQGSHSMALGIDADLHANEYGAWTNSQSQGDLSAYQNDWVYFWIYFSTLDYLRTPLHALSFYIGNGLADYYQFRWSKTDLAIGWNLCKGDFDNPFGISGTTDWSDIDYLRLVIFEVGGNTNDFTAYVDSIMFVRPMPQNHLVNLRHIGDTLLPARLLVTDSMEFGTRIATGDVVITGYITIKDASGNDRKLAIID